jgi:cell division protein ZipA
MDNFRLILIGCGVVLLVVIYLWGVTAARRRSEVDEADDYAGMDGDIDRVQDLRAAQNVEALVDLEDYDIDEDLEHAPRKAVVQSAQPSGPDLVQIEDTAPLPESAEQVVGEASEPLPEESSGQDLPGAVMKDDTPIGDLSGIHAIRDERDVFPLGQLDLLKLGDDDRDPRRQRQRSKKQAKQIPADSRASENLSVLAIVVMARAGKSFAGGELQAALEALGLRHGDMGIFHYRGSGKAARSVAEFSVANVLKPGAFELDSMADTSTPGVAMFVQLPGPDDPEAAFEEMLRTARELADRLDGVVCDETRSTLTGQAINHMRERIAEFHRTQRLRF